MGADSAVQDLTAITGPVSRAELARLPAPLELVEMTHPALRQHSRPIASEAMGSPELEALVAAMWAILDPLGYGVGLAASQVGLPYALFCLDDHAGTRFALANPERIGLPSFEWIEDNEGCLSIPGFWARVRRPAEQCVRGFLSDGQEVAISGRGFVARIIAHEIDHLVGRLFVDLALPDTFAPEDPDSLPGGLIFDRRIVKPSRLRSRPSR